MKVREAAGGTSNLSGMGMKDERRTQESKGPSFQSQLRHAEDENFRDRLNDLAGKIFEQGEKLGKKVDVREFKIYKKMISDFLDEALNNSHKFSKESYLDRRGRHKVYAVVKKINSELDELARDVLSNEKDNIKILQHLDDIRGLILDVVM